MLSPKLPIAFLALVNLALYLARAIVAGISVNVRLNKTLDGSAGELMLNGWENIMTPTLVQTTLIVSMIGLASAFAGLLHIKEWSPASRLVGVGVGVIACLLDCLCMGFAAKQYEIFTRDSSVGSLNFRSHFIAICAIVQVAAQLVYVMVLLKVKVEEVHREDPDKEDELAVEKQALVAVPPEQAMVVEVAQEVVEQPVRENPKNFMSAGSESYGEEA